MSYDPPETENVLVNRKEFERIMKRVDDLDAALRDSFFGLVSAFGKEGALVLGTV